MIVALDLSTTCTGVAFYNGGDKVQVLEIQGSYLAQFSQIESLLEPGDQVVYERHVHFRNGNVTRMLNELNGYVAYRLREEGYDVESRFPGKGRKKLIAAYEKLGLSKDEMDAVILVNSFIDSTKPLKVERTSYYECRNNGLSNYRSSEQT